MLTLFSKENHQLHNELIISQPQRIVLVNSSKLYSTEPPTLFDTSGRLPVLMYGGVAVAVIIAITYFSKSQFNSINKLIKTVKKETK
ncbi:MAG: hypothetical protein F6K21_07725 [Symploca sp. SIO2D2]|nr:hypothetical protein [Symploca sp. SIO2D2]